ncbi:crotonase/enoyl-CoA hydratase family protein [Spongiactinospora sp. TRM90649]|uniref:crotonase/enoyl-CoA hydratase family protein n=1 Tax=Spongiactinospora sp. TRM90649 TaxID=3031114 RepID=UPI0023F89F05|nr:crotonase/enoyl-CoA hydratase family protein [Spongiactinospora sp. TRM90649]MDF5758292.1 crotonase/enoyl-CoA hydratase family protein [Spongiactinospora sp. TRM90649]
MTGPAPTVRTETPAPGILTVVVDRPDARNAIDDATAALLATAMERLDDDDSLRVGVLTGAGGGFSAGLDLKAFLRGETGETPGRGFAGLARRPPRKPLIAAIEGFALAGGLEIALACDLIVAAEDARIGIPEVRRGLVADGGALLRLPGRLPRNIAMEMALTGAEVPVARLAELGLVNIVTRPGGSLAAAVDLAATIAANGPLGVVAGKDVLTQAPSWPEEEKWERQAALVEHVWTSADAREGARAFAARRPPTFTGT